MKLEPKGVMAFAWVVLLANCGLCGSLSTDYLVVQRNAVVYDDFKVLQGSVPTNWPELYYGFDESASDDQVNDDSFHGNSGTLTGTNVVWSSEGAPGTSEGSYLFNNGGTEDSYINVSYSDQLELTGPFTLAAWFKRTVPDDFQAFIMKAHNSGSCDYGLGENGGEIGLMVQASGFWTTNVLVQTGQWYHAVGVVEGSGANQSKIYVNGQLVQQGTLPLPNAVNGALYIGFWRPDQTFRYYFRGYIDEPVIYDRALSSTEVQQLYSNVVSCVHPTGVVFRVDDAEVTIARLKKQGDLEMGTFTNEP